MSEAIRVLCPWCHKGEVYIEGDGNAHVSIMCALRTLLQAAPE